MSVRYYNTYRNYINNERKDEKMIHNFHCTCKDPNCKAMVIEEDENYYRTFIADVYGELDNHFEFINTFKKNLKRAVSVTLMDFKHRLIVNIKSLVFRFILMVLNLFGVDESCNYEKVDKIKRKIFGKDYKLLGSYHLKDYWKCLLYYPVEVIGRMIQYHRKGLNVECCTLFDEVESAEIKMLTCNLFNMVHDDYEMFSIINEIPVNKKDVNWVDYMNLIFRGTITGTMSVEIDPSAGEIVTKSFMFYSK